MKVLRYVSCSVTSLLQVGIRQEWTKSRYLMASESYLASVCLSSTRMIDRSGLLRSSDAEACEGARK